MRLAIENMAEEASGEILLTRRLSSCQPAENVEMHALDDQSFESQIRTPVDH